MVDAILQDGRHIDKILFRAIRAGQAGDFLSTAAGQALQVLLGEHLENPVRQLFPRHQKHHIALIQNQYL
ncbi:hypothetical protein SDC9_201075 [bioreactor metagenome]|uniref:Uncharacterized protein n=1 Tax=bioreactor metagenome TaxID=1076179 RepID=A0A645IQ04_9ZZZZ